MVNRSNQKPFSELRQALVPHRPQHRPTANAESVVNDQGNFRLMSDLNRSLVKRDKDRRIPKERTLAISAMFGTLYFGLPMDSM